MTQPPDPADTDEARREETRRQAESQGGEALDIASGVVEAVANGAVDAAGAALDATLTVAQVSLDVVGGILGGLGDL